MRRLLYPSFVVVVLGALTLGACSGNSFSGQSANKRPFDPLKSASPLESGSGNKTPQSGKNQDDVVGVDEGRKIDAEVLVIPALKSAFVEVPKDTLGPEAVVKFIWNSDTPVEELEGWQSVVEVKTLGSNEWTEIGRTAATNGQLSGTWGERNIGAFETRITLVKDDFRSNSASANWAPHLFSAAILTRTVQCLFCHIRVEGDVGGIDFPAAGMHEASATGVQIIGELFSTNTIPEVFKSGPKAKGAVAAGSMFENYNNSGKKIFPTSKVDGSIEFPQISEEVLASRMLGRLTGHASAHGAPSVTVTKVHKGNLFLDGSDQSFEIRGEVFVEGDLVLKGSYKGQGTIYARNIFIIGDVTANKSPFPFASDEQSALGQARESILREDDALYLAALNQIWIAEYDTKLGEGFGVVSVSREAAFAAVGGEQRLLEIAQRPLGPQAYLNATPGETPWSIDATPQIRVDVQRVDAFLFANDAIVWRSHGNWLLNGGFISPKAAMTSRMQKETGSFWCNGDLDAPGSKPNKCGERKAELINPRNMLPSHTNVIRFDYRLRAGGVGFESIRELF